MRESRIDRVYSMSYYISYRTLLFCSRLFGVTAMKCCTDCQGHRIVSLTPHSEYLHCLQATRANLSSICSHVVP